MRIARIAGIVAVFLFLVGLRPVFALVPGAELPRTTNQTCGGYGYDGNGAWIVYGKGVNTQCAVDVNQSEGGVIAECSSAYDLCCKEKDGSGRFFPVCKNIRSRPTTPVVSGVEVVAEKTTYFEPNVPLPTLGSGALAIDGSLFAKYLGAFYVYFIGVIGILAVVMIMYGGYHYIVSMGNPSRMKQGKEVISGALIGLMLALTSFLLLNIINPALVNIHSIVPTFIARVVQTYEEQSSSEKTVDASINITPGGLTEIVQRIKDKRYDQLIRDNAGGDRILMYRALTVMIIESSGRPDAMSRDKNGKPLAYGLMQLLQSTGKQYGADPNKLFDPETNIKAGMKYLKALGANPCPDNAGKRAVQKKVECNYGVICTNTDYQYVYAAYNGGYDANFCSKSCAKQTWWQCTKNPGYAETRTYVQRAHAVYQWLEANKILG